MGKECNEKKKNCSENRRREICTGRGKTRKNIRQCDRCGAGDVDGSWARSLRWGAGRGGEGDFSDFSTPSAAPPGFRGTAWKRQKTTTTRCGIIHFSFQTFFSVRCSSSSRAPPPTTIEGAAAAGAATRQIATQTRTHIEKKNTLNQSHPCVCDVLSFIFFFVF